MPVALNPVKAAHDKSVKPSSRGVPVPDLARLYDLHAEDCVRTAEKIANPGHRAMLLKTAVEWRQAAQALRQSMQQHSEEQCAGRRSLTIGACSSNPPQGQGHRRRDAAPCWRMRPRADLTSDPPTRRKVWIWSSSWMARFRSCRFSASNRSSRPQALRLFSRPLGSVRRPVPPVPASS